MKSYNEKLRNPIINKPSNEEMGNSTKISKPRV